MQVLLFQCALAAQALTGAGTNAAAAVKLIIDTDMSTDCDDVGALCIAHALADRGEVELLAVVHNTALDTGVCAISAINNYYARPAIPIGAYVGSWGASERGAYVDDLCRRFPTTLRNASTAPTAVDVYRSVLAVQPDAANVTIASIGFLFNLEMLLSSGPDDYSPLSGVELLRRKVGTVVVMGGGYPRAGNGTQLPRGEWNFAHDGDPTVAAATHATLTSAWPVEVRLMFNGFEIGNSILTGSVLTNGSGAANPCRAAYIDHQGPGKDRPSWDPSTVLMAVRGLGAFWDAVEDGSNNIAKDGVNAWEQDGAQHNQSYVVQASSPSAVAAVIDALLLEPPRLSRGDSNVRWQ